MKRLLTILFFFAISKTASSQSMTFDSTVWTFIVKPEPKPKYFTNLNNNEKNVTVIKSNYKFFVSSIYLSSSHIYKSPFQSGTYLVKGKVFLIEKMVLGLWGPMIVKQMHLLPISIRRYFGQGGI